MRDLVLVAGLIFSAVSYAQTAEQLYEFMGIKLGAAMDEVKANPKLACELSRGAFRTISDARCILKKGEKETFAGVELTALSFGFYGDRLSNIYLSFPSPDFERMQDALVERYGAPTTKLERPLKTAKGAEAVNIVLRWGGSSAAMYIFMNKYGTDGLTSSVTFGTAAGLKEAVRRRDEAKSGARRP